jgi:hypothetical protein
MFDFFQRYPWFLPVHRYDKPRLVVRTRRFSSDGVGVFGDSRLRQAKIRQATTTALLSGRSIRILLRKINQL